METAKDEFVFLFRQPQLNLTKEQGDELHKKWMDWVGSIAAQGKVTSRGLRLQPGGSVLKAGGVVTDGPFVEIREILGGFIVVKADSLDEAITLAHGCPGLTVGGSVEIRTAYE